MTKKIIIIILLILAGTFILYALSDNTSDEQITDGLNTTTNFKQALNDAKTQNKKVLLIFDQDNCYYCDLLKEDTLSDLEVQKILNKYYIVVVLYVNKESKLAAEYKIYITPNLIFLDKNNKEIHRINGYVPANEFLDTLKEI
jgi:thioredoxin-related protein